MVGSFTFVVLDSKDMKSPIKVSSESAKLEPIQDTKEDTKSSTKLSEEQAQRLITPNFSKLVRALQAFADGEQSASPAERAALCADVIKNKRMTGLLAQESSSGSPTLYTVVPQKTVNSIRRALKENTVVIPAAEFSVWDDSPPTTALRLGHSVFGIVAEWRPPKGAIALELAPLVDSMLKSKWSVLKLRPREVAALENLKTVYTSTRKYILSHMPDSAYISGILTGNKQFLKQLRLMDIEHVTDSGTGIAYIRLFQIMHSLDELGLA